MNAKEIAKKYKISNSYARRRMRDYKSCGYPLEWSRDDVAAAFAEFGKPTERIKYANRKWDCAGYRECLLEAAKKNLSKMPCAKCRKFRKADSEDFFFDVRGCAALLMEVFGGKRGK